MGKPENEKEAEKYVDIANVVLEVERFNKLIEPFSFCLYAVDDVRRWKLPGVTIALWLISTLCCLILTQGAVFVLIAFLVVVIAAACLFQVHTRILDKILPDTRRITCKTSDEENNTLHSINDFRYSVIQMHDFVVKCNGYLSYFYALLKWDRTLPALIFHTEVCVFLLSLVVFPTRWICLLVVTWFYYGHKDTIAFFQCQWNSVQNVANSKASGSDKPATEQTNPSSSTSESQSKGSPSNSSSGDVTDSPDKEEFDEDIDESSLDQDELTLARLEPAPSRPGMVARLLELKRKKQQQINESCFTCKVSFASILRRRYICCHCGNPFCSKCCNQKVPRSVFGATSPAAQTETVIVCIACHEVLTKKDKDKNS